jgi:hypothetical protein
MAYSTSLRLPNRDDARWCVTIEADELPWPVRFFFLSDADGDGNVQWVNVAFEMGTGALAGDQTSTVPDRDQVIVSPASVRWVTANFFRYRRLAEDVLIWDREGVARTRAAMRRSARGAWTDESLSLLAAEHRAWNGRGATNALADAYGVHRTTIWRALKEAERRRL